MAITKASGPPAEVPDSSENPAGAEATFNANPGHPDEVVRPVREVPSRLVAEAQLRHELADSDLATPQERKQAAVERAHALSTRPDGSFAQLHETASPSLAVADDAVVSELRKDTERAQDALAGSEPANSPAGVRREEESARVRAQAADQASADAPRAQAEQAARADAAAKTGDPSKGTPSK